MARYSYELKKKIIEECLCGRISYQALVVRYRIEKSVPRLWISNYKSHSDGGLTHLRNNRVYSVEFKLEAITRYETSKCNYRRLALELGLTDPSMIINWRRQYREKDIERLFPHKRGRPMTEKNDHNQLSRTIKKNESVGASTHEIPENRIKGLKTGSRKLTTQKMFREQLGSLEKEETMNKRQRLSPNSESNSS